jgi:arylsulfatase A-like enzyme
MVTVLMDDIGGADIGFYGSKIATPNIDLLAGRGVRFTRYKTLGSRSVPHFERNWR